MNFAYFVFNIFFRHKVGVFACGPKPLTKAIRISCWKKYPQNTKFEFHQEVY